MKKIMTDGPIRRCILEKVTLSFAPSHVEVINESYMHSVPESSETHFKLVIVSSQFQGISLVDRHRKVNHLLETELKSGVHALSLLLKTPEQWNINSTISPSPTCRGGFGK
jgi:stress-induced morphogen